MKSTITLIPDERVVYIFKKVTGLFSNKFASQLLDLISIDLVRDVSKSPYFFISQGKDVRAMISIGADYALLPEPPEEIALRLTREIFSFLSENKYKLRY